MKFNEGHMWGKGKDPQSLLTKRDQQVERVVENWTKDVLRAREKVKRGETYEDIFLKDYFDNHRKGLIDVYKRTNNFGKEAVVFLNALSDKIFEEQDNSSQYSFHPSFLAAFFEQEIKKDKLFKKK